MAWLRSPVFYGILLLSVGALLRFVLVLPENDRPLTPETLRRALSFQQAERPILALEPRYRPYAFAFLRSFVFVFAIGFAVGGYHQLLMQSSKLTEAPSEFYLAAIIAGLVWSALFWALRAIYEGRLRLRF